MSAHDPGHPSRRAVLRAGAAGVVVAQVGWALPAEAAARAARLYRRRRFVPLVGKRFRLKGERRGWNVRLTEVRNLPRSSRGDDRCFRLTFTASVAGPPQGTYRLTRKGFTPTDLFLVPSDPERRTYQAIVNRPS